MHSSMRSHSGSVIGSGPALNVSLQIAYFIARPPRGEHYSPRPPARQPSFAGAVEGCDAQVSRRPPLWYTRAVRAPLLLLPLLGSCSYSLDGELAQTRAEIVRL